MHRKVRVNVATFGRFADSVNHQQQHRRSWAHAILTDARDFSLSPPSFTLFLTTLSRSLLLVLHCATLIPYYIVALQCRFIFAYANFLVPVWQIQYTQSHNIVSIFVGFLPSKEMIDHFTMDTYMYTCVVCSNCAFVCNIISKAYDRDIVSVDPV